MYSLSRPPMGAVVAVQVEEPQDDAVGDQLGGQGDDEGVQAELGNEEAVDQTDDSADGHDGQQGNSHPEGGDLGQEGQHLVGVVSLLQESAGDGGGQTDGTAGGQVGTGQNDTAGDTQSHGQVGGDLNNQVAQRAHRQEVGTKDRSVDTEQQHQDVQSIVQNAVHHKAALVLCIHLLVFSSSALQVCHRISHC